MVRFQSELHPTLASGENDGHAASSRRGIEGPDRGSGGAWREGPDAALLGGSRLAWGGAGGGNSVGMLLPHDALTFFGPLCYHHIAHLEVYCAKERSRP